MTRCSVPASYSLHHGCESRSQGLPYVRAICHGHSLVLILDSVHDGWGIAETTAEEGNAVAGGSTTHMDSIGDSHSYRKLAAHGLAVGLSDGLMGNSEVG